MPPRSGGIPVLYQTLGAATTAILCTGTVALFQDQFARGATLSGLNPDGGGPGFILLLIAGVVAYFTRPSSQSVLSIAGHTLIGLVYGLLAGGLFLFSLSLLGLPGETGVSQLVSGVVMASLVPRVIAPVLSWAWSETDHSVSAQPGGTAVAPETSHTPHQGD